MESVALTKRLGMFLLPRSERLLDTRKPNQLLLLSGMLAPEESYYPLVRYLRATQPNYGVAVIPLRFSLEDFDTVVQRANAYVVGRLLHPPKRIVLYGHSHGGRVAIALAAALKRKFSAAELVVITAGTPMVQRPDYLPLHYNAMFKLSKAYRSWPHVEQPDSRTLKRQIGLYSTHDSVVIPQYAKDGYAGELIELSGLSHHDLVLPDRIGIHLASILREIGT